MTEIEELSEVSLEDLLSSQLIVHNDNVNSFQHVINCFVKYLKHTPEQAEQCSLIIHFSGKCSVKKGSREVLLPLRVALTDNGLNATIE